MKEKGEAWEHLEGEALVLSVVAHGLCWAGIFRSQNQPGVM